MNKLALFKIFNQLKSLQNKYISVETPLVSEKYQTLRKKSGEELCSAQFVLKNRKAQQEAVLYRADRRRMDAFLWLHDKIFAIKVALYD